MEKYEILLKGKDAVAVELGTFQSPKDIDKYVKQGFVEQDVEILSSTPEDAINKFFGRPVLDSYSSFNSAPENELNANTSVESYRTGKAVYSFIEVIGWVLVCIGALAFVISLAQLNSRMTVVAVIVEVAPSFSIIFSGLISVAMSQVMRATIATAENSQKILDKLSK
ncbi:hypothetical protein ACJLUZ_001642 [Vibrio cholerae]|nr:hypothetical protein [Vibrio fluvialis]